MKSSYGKIRFFAVLISAMLLFSLSCAHTEKSDEADNGGDTNTEDVAASDGSGDAQKAPSDDTNQLENAGANEAGTPPAATTEAANTPADANAATPPAATETAAPEAGKGDDLTNLETAPQADEKSLEQQAAATPPAGDAKTATPPAADGGATNLEAAPPATDTATPPAAADTAIAPPPAQADIAAPTTTPDTAAAVPEATSPVTSDETKPTRHHHTRVARASSSSVPKIPGSALHRKGALLNRFYFVRKGDKPATVSQLIYGDAKQAKNLVRWNRRAAHMKAGTLIFYQSPTQASDTQMKSFYQEHNVSPEEYTVQKGDWLSRIAAKRLGSPASWKEIAVINGMESPDSLEVGKKIAVYPKDLTTAGQSQELAQNEATSENAAHATEKAAPTASPQAAQPPTNEPPVAQIPPVVPAPEEPVKKPSKAANGINVSKMIEQNFFAVAMGVLIVFLLVLLTALNKRKKSRRDDLADDFAAPKAKRK